MSGYCIDTKLVIKHVISDNRWMGPAAVQVLAKPTLVCLISPVTEMDTVVQSKLEWFPEHETSKQD